MITITLPEWIFWFIAGYLSIVSINVVLDLVLRYYDLRLKKSKKN